MGKYWVSNSRVVAERMGLFASIMPEPGAKGTWHIGMQRTLTDRRE